MKFLTDEKRLFKQNRDDFKIVRAFRKGKSKKFQIRENYVIEAKISPVGCGILSVGIYRDDQPYASFSSLSNRNPLANKKM